MADFFGKMKSTIVKSANSVADESGKLVERGKIKAYIRKLEDQKKGLIITLGEKYYAFSKQESFNDEELRAICTQIDALQAEIDTKTEEGERLKSEYGKHTRLSPLAESWELSCHKDGPSTIVNGPDAGRTLAEYAARHPACVGTRHTDGVFPVLIKLIDAARPLSVQVHPDDAYAQRVEGEPGKTEMWYVVDAQPGAQLYYGFQRELTREEAARRIADGTLTDVLNAVPVKAGDVFFIDAGTVHAIGAGIMLYEIQQSSDITYRFYDWDRVDKNGNRRELHLQKALDVTDLTFSLDPIPAPNKPVARVLDEKYFTLDLVNVQGEAVLPAVTAFGLLTALDGDLTVRFAGGQLTLRKGESAYIPHTAPVLTLHGKGRAALSMPR